MAQILLVDDEEELTAPLHKVLTQEGYTVAIANSGLIAWQMAQSGGYNLLILDWILPQMSGIEICRSMRARGDRTPVLLLTARDTLDDRVAGLDSGADDYLVKPFELRELLARVRALLRRNNVPEEQSQLVWGQIKIERDRGTALFGAHELPLTPKEYALLEMLVAAGTRLVKREDIVQKVWTKEQNPTDDTLRSHIKSLRHKLRVAEAPEDLIETVHSKGFRLNSNYQ